MDVWLWMHDIGNLCFHCHEVSGFRRLINGWRVRCDGKAASNRGIHQECGKRGGIFFFFSTPSLLSRQIFLAGPWEYGIGGVRTSPPGPDPPVSRILTLTSGRQTLQRSRESSVRIIHSQALLWPCAGIGQTAGGSGSCWERAAVRQPKSIRCSLHDTCRGENLIRYPNPEWDRLLNPSAWWARADGSCRSAGANASEVAARALGRRWRPQRNGRLWPDGMPCEREPSGGPRSVSCRDRRSMWREKRPMKRGTRHTHGLQCMGIM